MQHSRRRSSLFYWFNDDDDDRTSCGNKRKSPSQLELQSE